uniref:histone acetyltransferase n=1 Tax=Trichogramma kaykai TaxID=54128 RepID=A0ABD2XB79_9HYME
MMDEYLLQQGPPGYKRSRMSEPPLPSLTPNGNFIDARSNMVPFGFLAGQERDADMNMAAMSMGGGSLGLNPVQEFGQLSAPGPDWRHAIAPDSRNRFVYKISQALMHSSRNGENVDNRLPKWISAARKIEGKAFKMATSRAQYFILAKEEIHKIQSGYGFPTLVTSQQFIPPSSTTSSTAANHIQLLQQNSYGFGEQAPVTQSYSQPGLAHSATSVNIFPEEPVGTGGSMRIPVTSSMSTPRPSRGSGAGGTMVHEVSSSTIPIGTLLLAQTLSRSPRAHHLQQQYHHHHQQQQNHYHNNNNINNHFHLQLQHPPPPPLPPPPQTPSSKQQQQRPTTTSSTTNVARAFPGGGGHSNGGNVSGGGGGGGGNSDPLFSCNSVDHGGLGSGSLLHSMIQSAPAVGTYVNPSQPRLLGPGEAVSGVLSENSSIVNAPQQMPISRMQSKEWHKSVTFNVRNRLIRKMAQILSTTPDTQGNSMEARMHAAISIATGVENETHRIANSMTQYYDLMAKRCHYYLYKRGNNTNQPSVQFYGGVPDIRRTYEALGIVYPGSPTTYSNNVASSPRLHGSEAPPPPPPPGVVPVITSVPYCTYSRTTTLQQANHSQQLLDRFLQSTVANAIQLEGPGNSSNTAPESIKNLAHSFKCQQRENQENDVLLLCTLPFCRETKNLITHMSTCQSTGCNVCQVPGKEIVNHWRDCRVVDDCPVCLPIRQAEINLNQSLSAPPISNGPSMNPAPTFLRRPHHRSSANAPPYPSTHTATSGLLTNQVPGANQAPRNDRISSRSSMWHPNYPENPPPWRASAGPSTDDSLNTVNRRSTARYNWYPNNGRNFRMERRAPYPTNPWSQQDVLYIRESGPSTSGMQQQPHQHSSRSMFGNSVGSGRSNERAQAPYMSPWRNASPDLYTLVHGRPQVPEPIADSDEPVIVPDVEPAITEVQLFQAMMKVIRTNGCRLEQKFRCPTRPCEGPCIHRRLASSIRSHKTPIPA